MSSRPLEAPVEDALAYAEVLTEIGEPYDAEALVAEVLDRHPSQRAALELFAKIKHVRGRLSEAIACWAQLHASLPQNASALNRLAALMQMAKDPERGAGEFVAVGQFQLWRKPAAHLELEEAFGQFLSRRPDKARVECQRIAYKYRERERDVYKLAMLAEAWIAELSGDFDGAVSLLETLGRERGFETDRDRVLALARLYEQRGGRDDLEKAIHIHEFLLRGEKDDVSVLGSLAALSIRRGDVAAGTGYERRYLEAFRRWMHRPSFLDAVRVAARQYVPLPRLVALDLAPPSQPLNDAPVRERAISYVLVGQRPLAREIFASESAARTPLDLKYLGDLAALDGDVDGARAYYLRSLAADPEDLRVIQWLLDEHARSPRPEVADLLREPQLGERVRRRLEAQLRAAPVRVSVWRQLASLHRLAGRAADAERCEKRAAQVEESLRGSRRPVGRVLAAAVFHFVGTAKGLIHEVWAGRKPAPPGRGGFLEEVLGNLTPEMTQGARNTFLSVREFARARFPHRTADILDYNYTYKVTKEDEPSGGLSAGLPTALAFLSAFLDTPLPQDLASSGTLIADSHDVLVVGAVGEPEYKVRGAYNRNLRRLILPEANRPQLDSTPLVPRAVTRELVAYVSSFDQAVELVLGKDVWIE